MSAYVRVSGYALAMLCESAGYGDETIAYWRSFGSNKVEVSQASIDAARPIDIATLSPARQAQFSAGRWREEGCLFNYVER